MRLWNVKQKDSLMADLTEQDLDLLVRDRAIRLLVLSNGKRIWEASPSPLHQMVIDEIRTSITAPAPAARPQRGSTPLAGAPVSRALATLAHSARLR
jgi:hypothetical protein